MPFSVAPTQKEFETRLRKWAAAGSGIPLDRCRPGRQPGIFPSPGPMAMVLVVSDEPVGQPIVFRADGQSLTEVVERTKQYREARVQVTVVGDEAAAEAARRLEGWLASEEGLEHEVAARFRVRWDNTRQMDLVRAQRWEVQEVLELRVCWWQIGTLDALPRIERVPIHIGDDRGRPDPAQPERRLRPPATEIEVTRV